MRFTKMHGCGNDFIVIDTAIVLDADRVRGLCDRRRGIGADGILVIGSPEGRRWPITIHNADGSLGDSCGNGARCVARFLLDRHGGDALELSFAGGEVTARREGDGIAISLDAPSAPERVAIRMNGMGHEQDAYRVRVGNPHVVLFVDDPATTDLPTTARAVRAAVGEANVEVARVLEPGLITLRVDERGVGETQACGTGACAAVAAAARRHVVEGTVRVRLPGGELIVRQGPSTYELAGPAEYVFEGSIP